MVIGLSAGLVATARLGAVLAATPASVWLVEYPRLVDLSTPVAPTVRSRADYLAAYLDDPALFHARQAACVPASENGANARGERGADCLTVIDDTLRSNPSSGELWLLKAQVLMSQTGVGDEIFEALRNSYRTTPREGWIAAERVLAGLRLYPLLPADLQQDVLSDLELVLSDYRLAQPLTQAYPTDLALRRAGGEALRALPPDLLTRFVELVEEQRS